MVVPRVVVELPQNPVDVVDEPSVLVKPSLQVVPSLNVVPEVMVVPDDVVKFPDSLVVVMMGADVVVDGLSLVVESGAAVVVVSGAAHSPTIDGTASGPVPIGTRLVPQSSLLATWMLRLSQSNTM